MIRSRLARGLSRIALSQWIEENAIKPLIWCCWVLLTISKGTDAEKGAGELLISALMRLDVTLEKSHDEWKVFFSITAQPLLWHSDWIAHIPSIISTIEKDSGVVH